MFGCFRFVDLYMAVDWISERLYTQADSLWVRLAPTGSYFPRKILPWVNKFYIHRPPLETDSLRALTFENIFHYFFIAICRSTFLLNVMILYFLKRLPQIGAVLRTHFLCHPPVLLSRSEWHNWRVIHWVQ